MRFLEINEIWEWCTDHSIALVDRTQPSPDDRLTQKSRWLYTGDDGSGRESGLSHAAIAQLGDWDQTLLWITQTGIWPSTEDWPAYYAMRGELGERRSLEVAPGQLFESDDREVLDRFLSASMENGWDAFVLPALRGQAASARVQVSHDEWIELQSMRPISFPLTG